MTLSGPRTLRHDLPAQPAQSNATLAGRLLTMAVRRDVLMDRREVRLTVVITRPHMVYRIGARTAAHVADTASVAKDPGALHMPFTGKSLAAIAPRPATGSHQTA